MKTMLTIKLNSGTLNLSYRAFHVFGKPKAIVVWFRLEPIFNTALAASKNTAQFKSGQNRPNNNHLTSLI